MLALAITLAVIILISLLRFGVIVEYSKEGFRLWAKAGFIKFELLKEGKKKKPKKKKEKKEKKDVNILPGSLSEFMVMLKSVLKMLGRFKRRLLIKQLTLYYSAAGEDPAKTALQFGISNAAISLIVPLIRKNFRVKKLDLRSWFDFTSTEQGIYVKAKLSIAVWEVFYALFALFPILKGIFKNLPDKKTKDRKFDTINKNVKTKRKDGQDNGKTPNQRPDGNNNAKSEGND